MKFWFLVLLVVLVGCSTGQADPIPEGYENESGQSLLIEGLFRHERGEFEKALVFFNAAYFRFEEGDNKTKMAEVLAAKTLTLRRLDRLEEAVEALEQAVSLTEGTGGVVLPLYNLAKVQEQMGSSGCVETYQRAIDAMEEYRPSPHYRPAVLNDMQVHLGIAQLHFDLDPGDAEERTLAAIEALQVDEELGAFGKMVWVSGGYLGLTRHYVDIDVSQAWVYFDLAEEIIYEYPDETVLRRQDLENLREEMPPRP